MVGRVACLTIFKRTYGVHSNISLFDSANKTNYGLGRYDINKNNINDNNNNYKRNIDRSESKHQNKDSRVEVKDNNFCYHNKTLLITTTEINALGNTDDIIRIATSESWDIREDTDENKLARWKNNLEITLQKLNTKSKQKCEYSLAGNENLRKKTSCARWTKVIKMNIIKITDQSNLTGKSNKKTNIQIRDCKYITYPKKLKNLVPHFPVAETRSSNKWKITARCFPFKMILTLVQPCNSFTIAVKNTF